MGVAALATVATVLRAVAPVLDGPDPFWHWDVGRRMVDSASLLSTDPYSFLTAGREWVLNQWGAEVLFGLADAAGGLWLVGVATATLVGSAVLLAGFVMWRRAPSLVTLGLLGLSLMSLRPNWGLRGHLFTLMLLPVLLLEMRREAGGRPLRVLVLLLLWANLHGGFLLGLAVVGLTVAGNWVAAEPATRGSTARRGLQLVASAVAGASVSPYGPGFLLHTVQLGRDAASVGITEWAPTSLTEPRNLPFTLLLALVLTCTAVAASRDDLPDVLLVVVFGLLGMSASRNIAVASVGLAIVGAPYVVAGYDLLRHRRPRGASAATRLDRGLALGLALVALPLAGTLVPRSSGAGSHVRNLPLEAAERLSSVDRPVRLLTPSGWGPGLSVLGGDHVQTTVDGRVELFTRDEYEQFRTILSADPGWQHLLEEWCVTDLVVADATPLHDALAVDPDHELVFTDPMRAQDDTAAAWFTRSSAACRP